MANTVLFKGEQIPEEEIMVLLDDNDNECNFRVVLTYDMDDVIYAALEPDEGIEGFEDDEILIMRMVQLEDGEYEVAMIEDEEELDKAWEKFSEIYYSDDEEEEE